MMEFSLYFYNTEILKLQIRHLWIFVIFRYERPGNQPMAFGGAIGVADSAGGDDGMGDLCAGGSFPPGLCRGRHVRQEIELALAVDQDRDQRLAVLFLLLNTVGKVVRHAREVNGSPRPRNLHEGTAPLAPPSRHVGTTRGAKRVHGRLYWRETITRSVAGRRRRSRGAHQGHGLRGRRCEFDAALRLVRHLDSRRRRGTRNGNVPRLPPLDG